MAEKRRTTPERQLLRLIEEPNAQGITQKGIRRKGLGLFSVAALKGRLSFLKEKLNLRTALKRPSLTGKSINAILKFCILVLSVYLLGSSIISMRNLNKIPEFGSDISSRLTVETPKEISLLKHQLSYYLEQPRARDIFRFGQLVSVPKEEVLPPWEEVYSKIEDVTKDLEVVGIGWWDDPDVMIEDTSAKKVYFLKRGQWIDEKIKVEAIFKDRVILSYEGEEIELK